MDTSERKLPYVACVVENQLLHSLHSAEFAMQTSGNDIFYRNPYDVNECLFVNLSSPSSSKYKSVRSIGTPDAVAEKARRQYLREMMSTRLGVKRESDVVSSADRVGSDGNEYYDLQVALHQRRSLCDFPLC